MYIKKNIIVKLGILKSIIVLTFVSIFSSVLITWILLILSNNSVKMLNIVIAIIAPVIIAPPVVFFLGKLLIKISKLEYEMRLLATYDQLTGVLTRHAFIESGKILINLAERKKKNISLIFFDLDYFKKINDTFGHDAGDYILRESGKIFKKNKRKSDLISRIGGEEFIIILPDTNSYGASIVAEKLRKIFLEYSFIYGDNKINVTASMGIADFSHTSIYNLDTLMKHADNCLYQSKKNGRNQVTIYKQETSPNTKDSF